MGFEARTEDRLKASIFLDVHVHCIHIVGDFEASYSCRMLDEIALIEFLVLKSRRATFKFFF